MVPPRVVSLLPSATELVCALGAEPLLVGISHECDFPASVRDRPVLTRSRLGPGGTSAEIDGAVRALVADALSIYAVDEVRLGELAPDVIITQDLCAVCAVSLDDVRSAVARIARRERVDIVSLSPTRLGDDPDRGVEAYDRRSRVERTWDVVDAVRAVADGRGVSMAQVALAWLVDRPAVTSVILGARTTSQLDDNLAAAGLHLSDEETARLDAASDPGAADYPYGGPGVAQRGRKLEGGW